MFSGRFQRIFIGIFIFFSVFLIHISAQSKLFQNAYVSFQLPDNWGCELDATEWVCVNKFSKKYKEKKEAVIILTAKERGPSDSLDIYESHLKKPRNLVNGKGKRYSSQIKTVKRRKVSRQTWVDGLHLGGEVQNYYTRYLATIKDKIAMLVTFTAHKEHYSKYSSDFIKAIQSLRVIASDQILAGSKNQFKKREQDLYALPVGQMNDALGGDSYAGEHSRGLPISKKVIVGLALLSIGGLGLYFLNRGKKRR